MSFTQHVEDYARELRETIGTGAAFKGGVAKRFAGWADANGWDPQSVPEDIMNRFADAVLAEGRGANSAKAQVRMAESFLEFLGMVDEDENGGGDGGGESAPPTPGGISVDSQPSEWGRLEDPPSNGHDPIVVPAEATPQTSPPQNVPAASPAPTPFAPVLPALHAAVRRALISTAR